MGAQSDIYDCQCEINVSQKFFLTWLEQQNYYDVHEGAVESQNYVGKRLTKK